MNENIGAKGTKKDHIRNMIISKKRKEKIKREYKERKIKEQEKLLKRQQIENIIKVIPIAIIGETLSVLTSKFPESREKEEKYEFKSESDVTRKIIINDKVKMIIKSKTEVKEINKDIIEINKDIIEINKDIIEINKDILTKQEEVKKQKEEKGQKLTKEQAEKQEEKKQQHNSKNLKKTEKNSNKNNKSSTILPIALAPLAITNIKNCEKSQKNKQEQKENKKSVSNAKKETLKTVETIKLIEAYEKRFKDVRYELKALIFEYNIINEQLSKTYREEDVEKLIERLNLIIRKLEELKRKINIDNIKKYDDNYLYNLVEEYIKCFDDKQIISEIKDSDLYISLSSKIEELDTKKDKLSIRLTNKKDKLHITEENMAKLKEGYYDIKRMDELIEEFQKHQEETIKTIQEKIKNSEKIYEKTETKIIGMTEESQRLLDLLTLQMMTPGLNSAKAMITTTMIYLMFMRRARKPKVEVEKYKIIKVTDYSNEIEKNISSIDDISNILSNTTNKLEEMIEKVKTEYRDFISEIPECNRLIQNLENAKTNLQEKEYEINKIKELQKENLEKNKDKMKSLNNKRVV